MFKKPLKYDIFFNRSLIFDKVLHNITEILIYTQYARRFIMAFIKTHVIFVATTIFIILNTIRPSENKF